MKLTKEEFLKFKETEIYVHQELIEVLKEYLKIDYPYDFKMMNEHPEIRFVSEIRYNSVWFSIYDKYEGSDNIDLPIDYIFDRVNYDEKIRLEKERVEQQRLNLERKVSEENKRKEIERLKELMKKYPKEIKS
jgi:hypothetical protein